MSYFRNVQNNGNWVAGNFYTFEIWVRHNTISPFYYEVWRPLLTFNISIHGEPLFLDDYELPVYPFNYLQQSLFDEGIEDSVLNTDEETIEGSETDGGEWRQYTVDIPEELAAGSYKFAHGHWLWHFEFSPTTGMYYDSIPVYEEYDITIYPVGSVIPPDPIIPPVPDDRPEDYNFDFFWVPGSWDGDEYTPPHFDEEPTVIVAAGGGRWSKNLVAAGNGKIYYEDYS